MLATPDTEQLGLRGLYLEAGREHEEEAQRQFAERALRLNPKLVLAERGALRAAMQGQRLAGRASDAGVCAPQWPHRPPDRRTAPRRAPDRRGAGPRGQRPGEGVEPFARGAWARADLIPAAAIAGRLLASRGNTPRAAKIIQKTWAKSPHPELATAYAYARIGDSPRDRLDRVRQLAALNPYSIEKSDRRRDRRNRGARVRGGPQCADTVP